MNNDMYVDQCTPATQVDLYSNTLRYDLIDSDHIAFMFNVGTFPDLSMHQIDTNICMRHLSHNT